MLWGFFPCMSYRTRLIPKQMPKKYLEKLMFSILLVIHTFLTGRYHMALPRNGIQQTLFYKQENWGKRILKWFTCSLQENVKEFFEVQLSVIHHWSINCCWYFLKISQYNIRSHGNNTNLLFSASDKTKDIFIIWEFNLNLNTFSIVKIVFHKVTEFTLIRSDL